MIYDVEINSAAHYPAAEVPGLVVLAEQVGFGAFWKGESNSTDPVDYQWRRDGVDLANGPTGLGSAIAGADSHTLIITNARPDHLDVMGPNEEDVAWA